MYNTGYRSRFCNSKTRINNNSKSFNEFLRGRFFPVASIEDALGILPMSRNVPRGQAAALADFRCLSPGRVRKSNGGKSYAG